MTAVAPTNRRRRRSSRCGRIVSKNPAKAVSVISTPPHYTANLILWRTLSVDLSRAQMGTFMCRLSGNCGVAPSVDATTVDGLDSTDFLGATATAVDSDKVDGLHAGDIVRVYGRDQHL